MSREERAKQFMPFAALKGYNEALRKKEKMVLEELMEGENPLSGEQSGEEQEEEA